MYLHAAPDKPQGILSATSLSISGPGGIQLYRTSPYSTFWVNYRSGSCCITEFDLSMLTAFLIYWMLLIRRREVCSGKMTQLQALTLCLLFWHVTCKPEHHFFIKSFRCPKLLTSTCYDTNMTQIMTLSLFSLIESKKKKSIWLLLMHSCPPRKCFIYIMILWKIYIYLLIFYKQIQYFCKIVNYN